MHTLTVPLNANDRCDRCGAQAYLRVEVTADTDLLFCAHHGSKHYDKLFLAGYPIHDETANL